MNLGTGIIAAGGVDLVFNQFSVNAGGSASISVGGLAFGEEHARRRVFAVIGANMFRSSGGPKSVTIGGVAATQHVQNAPAVTIQTGTFAGIWSAAIPSGTSGTIAFNSGNGSNLGNVDIAVYSSYRQRNVAAFDTSAYADGSSGSGNLNIDIPSGGFLLACCCQANTLVCTSSLSSTPALTSDAHDQTATIQGRWGSAMKMAAASPLTLSGSYTNSGGGPFHDGGCAASFR